MGRSNKFGGCGQHTDELLTGTANLIKRILGTFYADHHQESNSHIHRLIDG